MGLPSICMALYKFFTSCCACPDFASNNSVCAMKHLAIGRSADGFKLQLGICMNYKKAILVLTILSSLMLTGCAAYRTEKDAALPTAATTLSTKKILIREDALAERKYKELGPVTGEVKKLTMFHSDPTRDQVNLILTEKAQAMGADAVVKVTYKTGIGLMTWGYIEATGVGVKFDE